MIRTLPSLFVVIVVVLAAFMYQISLETVRNGYASLCARECANTGLSKMEHAVLAEAPDVKILSFDPFIAHITDFVTITEREYLKNLS